MRPKATATARAQAGAGAALTCDSAAGDVAILIMAGQLQADPSPSPVPDGWVGQWQPTVDGTNRSGYVAWRRVTDPSQTRDVAWWVKQAAWTARQRAALLVFDGRLVSSVKSLAPWRAAAPALAGDAVLCSQSHAPAGTGLNQWQAGDVVVDGGADVDAAGSWSALRAAVGQNPAPAMGGEGIAPAAWCGAALEVKGAPRLTIWEGGREVVPLSAALMPYGAPSAAEFAARRDTVTAHRGGSGIPGVVEHTMAAYTRSVARGVDALEISCHRTRDGVWIASHDPALGRVGGPQEPISTLTWAQVRRAFENAPGSLPVTLEEYLAVYGGSHVTVFDPKAEMARSDEYLAILAPYKDRVLIKAFADADWLFKKVRLAGWATWGYAYARNRTQPWWTAFASGEYLDVLSMEWDAPAEMWAALTASGKPVISHIPSDASQVAAAAAKGAAGCISSRPDSLLPSRV